MKKLLCLVLLASMLFSVLPHASASTASYVSRSDFSWGVNGHNRYYASYPEKNLKTQVKLAAELGSKIYRFNYNPVTEEDFAYLDTVLAEVLAYGMDMMLVLDDAQGTPEAIAQRIGATAARYTASSPHGFIRYLQVFGEADIPALLDSNPTDVPDGSRPSHYSDAVINDWYGRFQSALGAIRAVNTDSKTVISISYLHYGFLTALKNKGLQWDIIGLDWYADMGAFSRVLTPVKANFTQDILITETNIRPSGNNTYAPISTWSWLTDGMAAVYAEPRVKGLIFYELMDEPAISDPVEAYCGLVGGTETGDVTARKAIYTYIQEAIGGGPRQPAYPIRPPAPSLLGIPLKAAILDETGDSALLGNGGVAPGFHFLADTVYNDGVGPLDLTAADAIAFDFFISDYHALAAAMANTNGGVTDLFFFLGSTPGNRYGTREGAPFLNQITGSGWNHIVLPLSAFTQVGTGTLDASQVSSWMLSFAGPNIYTSLGAAADVEVACANICAVMEPPLTMTLLDKDFSSYTFPDGAAYSWLWDTLYSSGLPPVDLSACDTITFEFYVSDYAAFTERLSGGKGASDIRFTLGSDSGNRYNSRASVSFLDQITRSGWNTVEVKKDAFFVNGANGQQPDWAAVSTWSCYFEGSAVMSPAQMSGLLLGVRQVGGVRLTLPDEPAGIVARFGETINQTFETGATFLYAFDRLCLEGMTPAVDFTQADNVEFDVFVSDYSILTNSPGDLRIDFTSGANRWEGRVPYSVSSQIQGMGWNHVVLPIDAYVYNAGDLSAVRNVMFYREGGLDASIAGLNVILANFCLTNS